MPQNENITVTFTSSKEGESKMKPGEKYILEIESVSKMPKGDIAFIKGFRALVFDQYGLDHLERYDDKKARKTIDDAVDAAYKRGWNDGRTSASLGNYTAGYNDGMHTAWAMYRQMAKEITTADLKRLFNLPITSSSEYIITKIVCDFTPDEVEEKLGAFWKEKKEKSEIHLGDEVRIKDISKTFFVTHISGNLGRDGLPYYSGIKKDGLSAGCCGSGLEKTGRHVDVSAILGQPNGQKP